MADLKKDFKKHNMITFDEDDEFHKEGLQIAKLRGKGAPKKKRTADSKYPDHTKHVPVLIFQQQVRKERRESDAIALLFHDTLYMIPLYEKMIQWHCCIPMQSFVHATTLQELHGPVHVEQRVPYLLFYLKKIHSCQR